MKKRIVVMAIFCTLFLIACSSASENRTKDGVKLEFDSTRCTRSVKDPKLGIIDSKWISDSICVVETKVMTNCCCGKLENADFKLNGKKLILTYEDNVGKDEKCCRCSCPATIFFRLENLVKKDYKVSVTKDK